MNKIRREKIKKETSETSPVLTIYIEPSGFESTLEEAFHGCESVEIIPCSGRTIQKYEHK